MAASNLAKLVSLNKWLEQTGVSPTTGWRWRNKGVLKTTNIYGRHYISQEAIEEFYRRASTGEFVLNRKPGTRTRHE